MPPQWLLEAVAGALQPERSRVAGKHALSLCLEVTASSRLAWPQAPPLSFRLSGQGEHRPGRKLPHRAERPDWREVLADSAMGTASTLHSSRSLQGACRPGAPFCPAVMPTPPREQQLALLPGDPLLLCAPLPYGSPWGWPRPAREHMASGPRLSICPRPGQSEATHLLEVRKPSMGSGWDADSHLCLVRGPAWGRGARREAVSRNGGGRVL